MKIESKIVSHMACHETFLSLENFSLSLPLPEMLNIENDEYVDPLLLPLSVC